MGNKTFSEALDFSRGTAATYYDANGTLQTAGPNEPRLTHDPDTGEPQGLLIEEQRTNLLLWSEDFTKSEWSLLGASAEQVPYAAPSGMSTIVRLKEDSSDSMHELRAPLHAVEVDTSVTLSVFAKADDRRYLRIYDGTFWQKWQGFFDLHTGKVVSAPGESQAKIEQLKGGWYRCSISYTNTEGVARARFALSEDGEAESYQGDGTSGIYIWGAQLEEGTQPSSYIKTEGSQVTRAADNCSRTLGAEFNPSEGVVYISGSAYESVSTFNYAWMLSSGNPLAEPWLGLTVSSAGYVRLRSSEGSSITNVMVEGFYGVPFKLAVSYDMSGTVKVFYNGIKLAEWMDRTDLNTVSHLFLRNGNMGFSGLELEGTTSDFKYIPKLLSESELIALTTPEAS